jgi:hypothetical protein
LRRELQRLNLLASGTPVPPTPVLDAEWETQLSSGRDLCELASDHDFLGLHYAELAHVLKSNLASI